MDTPMICDVLELIEENNNTHNLNISELIRKWENKQ